MTQVTGQGQLRPDDVRQGAILILPGDEKIRCQVDRVDETQVHMRVLDNQMYNGQREFTANINDLITNRWQLTKKAA